MLQDPRRVSWRKINEVFEVGHYGMFFCNTDDFFGQVMAKSNGKLVIRVWPSHRKELMDQTSTNALTEPLVLDFKAKSAYKGKWSLNLYSFIHYGKTALPAIEKHITVNEGLWDLSSCFFYHGAKTIPDQLVYAAELVCFLKGYKPLAMVQMRSDSDSQLKFPFVDELVQAMIVTADFYPDAGIRYQKNIDAQNKWETIIFYSECSLDHARALLPQGKAQAHHIYPIPDENNKLNYDPFMKQLEHSFFNGIALGYPERFIHVYCEDLISKENMEKAKMTINDIEKAITLARERYDKSMLEFMLIQKGMCEEFERVKPLSALFEKKDDCDDKEKAEL